MYLRSQRLKIFIRYLHVRIRTIGTNKILRSYRMNSDVGNENHWRGVPITEIYGSQSPWGAPEFPLVAPSFNHAVLYHIPSVGSLADDRPPKPQIGHDKWDHDFVRMPCSSQSLYPVDNSNGETQLKRRWDIIEYTLWKPIRNSQELADAILAYNTKFKSIWKFRALHKLFNEYLEEEESQYFFDVTLPEMAKLALALPKLIQSPIPLLKQHKNRSISLSQQQIASLLANAFFCTFPRRNTTKKSSEYATYPHINFNTLYNCQGTDSILEKLKCICHYFRRICTKVPVGVMTFSRRSVPPRDCPDWGGSTVPIASLPLHVEPSTTIEDAHGLIQVDFANKYLGGGVLGHGCVQEEIRFVICPELMVSMLFTEVLTPNEALMMIGCERYSDYTGYGGEFRWAGDHRDATPRDQSSRRRCAVLAVDALPYSSITQEYRRECITRELNKAWIGVTFYTDGQTDTLQCPGIATGNWGCGAFGGSAQLKSLVQVMACALARRPMAYYTFQDVKLRDEIINVYNELAKYDVTVGRLYKYILSYSRTDVRKTSLNTFLYQVLKNEEALRCRATGHSAELIVISQSTEENQYELPVSLQEEFLNCSEDLFSQDESEKMSDENEKVEYKNISSTSNKESCENSDNMTSDLMASDEHKMASIEHKMASSEHKVASSEHKMASSENKMASTSHTSRLFEEMKKFDNDNGKLNFTVSHTSPLNESESVSVHSDALIDNDDKLTSDAPSEIKNKIRKKITDYFNKKTI